MALSTTEHHAPAHPQQPSPGVGQQGAQPVAAPTAPAKPVLFEDIDPVLLVRLYPGATDAADMRAQAMAQGVKTAAEGAETVASQNEPVVVLGAEPPTQQHPAPHQPPH